MSRSSRRASGGRGRGLLVVLVLAVVALLIFADRTVLAAFALVAAVLFVLAVVIVGLIVILLGETRPASWMLDDDGHLLSLPTRMRLLVQRAKRRVRQRPNRPPERVLAEIAEQANATVWHRRGASPMACSHLHVAVHPDTLALVDGWMPVEDVAAEVAAGYARTHARAPRRSSMVVVLISADPDVPLGTASVQGSFREAVPQSPTARGWAPLAGPVAPRQSEDALRLGGPLAPSAPSTRLMPAEGPAALEPGEDPTVQFLAAGTDRTRMLPNASTARHEVAPAPAPAPAPAAAAAAGPAPLRVRRCQPGGAVLPGSTEHVLDPSRPWTAGRDAAADIRCTEPHVSRMHAQFEPGPGGWVVRDRSSRGTFINGNRVPVDQPAAVRPGDVVEFGERNRPESVRVLLLVS
jgi:hypothetical protein